MSIRYHKPLCSSAEAVSPDQQRTVASVTEADPSKPQAGELEWSISVISDQAINYAFQQNSIPVVKELRVHNIGKELRKSLVVRMTTEPLFANPNEIHLQELGAGAEFRDAPIDLKLSPEFLGELNEKLSGLLRVDICQKGSNGEPERTLHSIVHPVDLLARNEWCGLISLPEILAAFVLPNDPAIMPLLGRASEILRASTGRADLNGYQDKNRKRVWEQVAAIYKAVAELKLRYIVPPASFENTGQKVRFPSDIIAQRFATCLDLTLLFAACCEQAGLHPLILMHEGHAYSGCWLEERTLSEPSIDDLQHIRKLFTDGLVTVFEATTATTDQAGTLVDAETLAKPLLQTTLPFRAALDVRRSRIARIHPLPIAGQAPGQSDSQQTAASNENSGIGERPVPEAVVIPTQAGPRTINRIDQWKSRLLDLSLRNKLINFKPTKATIPILSASPEHIEDELASDVELALHPKPKLMDERDPRNAITYTRQQRTDAVAEHLRDELADGRLRTGLDQQEHSQRLTELYRAARLALEENGTNTLYLTVGILEWRETEHGDRTFRAPILLVPVELKRKSVLEGFSLRRIDEDTRLNVTLMEMLRQQFHKEIAGLDPLPSDERGVDVASVFQLFREAVRELAGWEVKSEVWLGQFSFTKFLLWKDLADRLEALTQNRVVRHLVHEAGSQYPNPDDDVHPAQLDQRFHPRDVYCPRSADSSQLAAVLAAAEGHDLVLEGPPGTGKSQTISNIIAHCLAHGKRVLFVAEKRAALDVVHRRLREEGLEPFCLELHSNKSGKAEVLGQFDQSLKFADSSLAIDWDSQAEELGKARNSLNAYVRALHFRYHCGLSAFHCFDYLLPRKDEPVVRLDWPSILETSAETLNNAREIAHLLQERSKPLQPLADHPMAPISFSDWSPRWADSCLELMQPLRGLAHEAAERLRDVRNWLGLSVASIPLRDLQNTAGLAESLLHPQSVGAGFATRSWSEMEPKLNDWTTLAKERNELRDAIQPLFAVSPQAANPKSGRVPCEEWAPEQEGTIVAGLRELFDTASAAAQSGGDVGKRLPLSLPLCSRRMLVQHVILVDCLLAPQLVAAGFVTCQWEDFTPSLERWINLLVERRELRLQLADYDEAKLLHARLDFLQERWNSSRGSWFLPKLLRTAQVRNELGKARRDGNRPTAESVNGVLSSALRLRAIIEEFSAATPLAVRHLGVIWNDGEPNPDLLKQVRTWGDALHSSMRQCVSESPESLAILRNAVAKLFEDGVAAFGANTGTGMALTCFRERVTLFDSKFETLSGQIGWSREILDNAEDHISAVAAASKALIEQLPRLRSINEQFREDAPMGEDCLGALWNKGEPVPIILEQVRAWGEVLHGRMLACAPEDLPVLARVRQLLSSLFAEGIISYGAGTRTHERLVHFVETIKKFSAALDHFATAVHLHPARLKRADDYFSAIIGMLGGFESVWPKVRLWCSWQKARKDAMNLRLEPVLSLLESAEGYQGEIELLFERSFRRAFLSAVIENEPVLRDFFGHEHAGRIAQFCRRDEKMADLTRRLIRAKLAAAIPRDKVPDDIPKAELGLLRKELSKKTRHIPVRQLLSRIPSLLPRLKPCVLMSPLSVAQYLEASHELFDVVIFDEASQIPVWDAVGAIARGKQLIVVGDPKQLPPTNFFNTAEETEDDSNDADLQQDLESILDELLTVGMRHKRLQWHYRSRHESLISFSNRHYYENDLLTFPSPHTDLGGVRFKHLPGGRYDKGKTRTNLVEARALVDELVGRLRSENGATLSFGVVTFNQAQQKLIEDLIDEERRKFPEIEIHFGDQPPVVGEPVFVKNLENVQGDERDVILFSICYGPDESERVSMNFGPLNRDGGERRLNVAITRAKQEVIVFSTLRADQIDLTRTRARGARDLKFFLEYAERGPRAFAEQISRTDSNGAESEFEHLVANRIRAAGFDVHHQVGCSGYRIDLAVVDPNAPGRYLLGIECDGATYHRAATARDRDKLRQAVLERLGWRIHRIWSTDWWHDSDAQIEKLTHILEELSPVTRFARAALSPN